MSTGKGRRAKPTAIKKLAGNPGKRALPENEPQPERARPPKPTNLSGTASRLWDYVSEELFNMGVLTTADGPGLRMLCESWHMFFEARRALNQHGSMFYETHGPGGVLIKTHPAVNVMKESNRAVKGWLAEFGLTPAARTRVEKALDNGEEDEIESFFTGEGSGDGIRDFRH